MAKPAKSSEQTPLEKLHQWVDSFHNTEPERHPSRIGSCLTILMIPVVLIYAVVWFVDNQQKPPTEQLVIDWSVAFGPYPMKVECFEASCQMYLSGCESSHANRCITLAAGEEMDLEMCYSWGAREGLHVWWTGTSNSSGLQIHSQAATGWTHQTVEAGRSQMTYVKTEDRTKQAEEWERLRHEWFVMYLSNEALEPLHNGCQRSGQAAQIVMKPEFYERSLFREDFVVSLIGEVGGAYGIISTVFFGLYLVLWNTEYGYRHREDLPFRGPVKAAEKAEEVPKAFGDVMMEPTQQACV